MKSPQEFLHIFCRSQGTQQCSTPWNVSGASGEGRVYAVIDPANAIAEMHEQTDLINNNKGYGLLTIAGGDYFDPGLKQQQAYQPVLYQEAPGLRFDLYLPTNNQTRVENPSQPDTYQSQTVLIELVPTITGQLKSIGNHDVSKAVEKWKSFCDATAETAKSSNKRTFVEASTLRGSLLELNICTPNNVDEALGKLTHPSIDITTLEDLKGMSKDELTSAGWSLKMAKDCVAKLASK